MSDFIPVSSIKDSLTECPICTEHFNDTGRLPRRMPCCVQSICQPCLQLLFNTENTRLPCPLCRHDHQLPDGVASLPIESLILKILDYLKIQKGLRLPCTDCPDKNEAIARCDDCCVFLCEDCHRAHARHRSSRSHETVTFDEMKHRPVVSFRQVHHCTEHQQALQFYCFTCSKVICVSCTVVEHDKSKGHNVVSVDEAHQDKATSTDDALTKLDEKMGKLEQSVQELEKKKKNIETSRQKATDDVNQTFDNLMEILQNRRTILLSDIEDKSSKYLELTEEALNSSTTMLTKIKASTEYTKQMRGRADKIEELQLMVSSTDSLNTMLEESLKDVKFYRAGVSFVPDQVKQMALIMEALGVVRVVTFTPTQKPRAVRETEVYNDIQIVPTELPRVLEADMKLPGQTELICPHLEWDTTTASDNITISQSVVINTKPNPPLPDTGCRLQAPRRVLTSRPLVISRGQRFMYHVKVRFSFKMAVPEKTMLFESALTNTPTVTTRCQAKGLAVCVASCFSHAQQICLWVVYDNKILTDFQIAKNQTGESRDLHLCFLLDGDTNKIHIVDVDDVKVIRTVTDVVLDRPLWTLMYVDLPTLSDMRGELVAGQNVTVTQEIKQLLSSLH